MKSTYIAAWWGAIVASLVLAWDIYKWKNQGPQLTMRLSPHMKVIGDPTREGITWITITVSNIGDRPTTIKGVGFEYYKNWFHRLRCHVDESAVFPNPSNNFPLPRVLNPGDEWVGFIPHKPLDKDIDIETMSQSGHLMIYLSQSHSAKTKMKRLVITPEQNEKS